MASPSLSQIGLLVIMTSAALGACDDSHPDATKNAASSSGNGAAVEVDGGEVDGGDVDRAADASIDRETTPPVDSGPAGADAASGCVGFCDDFDDRTAVLGGWTTLEVAGAGIPAAASITSSESMSPPHSLRFHVPAQATAGDDGVLLQVQLPLVGATMKLDFDIKMVGNVAGYSGYVNVVQLLVGNSYVGGVSALAAAKDADYFVTYPDGGITQPVGVSKGNDESWHHVHYEAVYDRAAGSVLATWDEVTILQGAGTTFGAATVPTTLRVAIGGVARQKMPAMDVYFDNVWVR